MSRQRPERNRYRNRAAASKPAPRRQILWFSVSFLALLLLFSAVLSSGIAERWVHAPTERLLTLLAWPVLALLGDVSVSGNRMSFNDFPAVVVEECNGILPMYIFVAAVLAFPSNWRAKWWGILIGVPSMFLINLLRVISLMLLGAFRRDLFDQVHIYVWQALVIAITVAIWVYWAETFVRPHGRVGA